MKRRKLERILTDMARKHNLAITFRQGGNRTIALIRTMRVAMPRHREINEITATSIIRYCGKEPQ